MKNFKVRPLHEVIEKLTNPDPKEKLDELEGEAAFDRGETLSPRSSEAFKRGYEKRRNEQSNKPKK